MKSALLSLSVRTCFFFFFFFFFEPGVSSAELHRTVLLPFPKDLCFPVLAPNGVIVSVCSHKDLKVYHVTSLDNGKQTGLSIQRICQGIYF